MLSGGKAGLVSAELLRREQQEHRRQEGGSRHLEGESLMECCPPLLGEHSLGVGGAEARSAVFPRTGHAPLVEAQLDFFSPSGLSQSMWPSWHPSQCVAFALSALCKCSPAYTWFAPVSFLGEVFASFSLQNDRENRVIPSSVLGTDLLNLLSVLPQ